MTQQRTQEIVEAVISGRKRAIARLFNLHPSTVSHIIAKARTEQ